MHHRVHADLFDSPTCIGFIRHGTAEAPGCVVILSNGEPATLTAELGPDHAGATFVDWLGHAQGECVADDQGALSVRCEGGSVSGHGCLGQVSLGRGRFCCPWVA